MSAHVLLVVLATTLTPPPPPAAPAPAPSPPAPAEPSASPAPIGLLAGAATVIVPLVAGSLLLAADDQPDRQMKGIYVITAGFALAPFVAHGARGSWRRALGYGGVSLALSAATVVAMHRVRAFEPQVQNRDRVPFGVLLSLAFGSAVVGVVSSAIYPAAAPGADAAAPRLSLWLSPSVAGLAWSTAL